MANYKENPRTETITIRVTPDEKELLQKLAGEKTRGRVSQLVWEVLTDWLYNENLRQSGSTIG